jgi:hypothetical protein
VDFKKSPGPGRTTRPGPGFCIVWNTVNKQEADNMEWSFVFFLNSALLGVGLAMDAFSVSMANGLHDPKMGKDTMCRIAGTFGVFQAVMPMTGRIVRNIELKFREVNPFGAIKLELIGILQCRLQPGDIFTLTLFESNLGDVVRPNVSMTLL